MLIAFVFIFVNVQAQKELGLIFKLYREGFLTCILIVILISNICIRSLADSKFDLMNHYPDLEPSFNNFLGAMSEKRLHIINFQTKSEFKVAGKCVVSLGKCTLKAFGAKFYSRNI